MRRRRRRRRKRRKRRKRREAWRFREEVDIAPL
jgi:hypothetical protein